MLESSLAANHDNSSPCRLWPLLKKKGILKSVVGRRQKIIVGSSERYTGAPEITAPGNCIPEFENVRARSVLGRTGLQKRKASPDVSVHYFRMGPRHIIVEDVSDNAGPDVAGDQEHRA